MDILLLVAGFALVALAFGDALATTLTVAIAAGPLTRRLAAGLWAVLLRARRGSGGSTLLRLAGAALLIIDVLVWVTLLWAGWTFVLLAGDPAVVHSDTGVSANIAQTVYYAGFTVFTLGVGDFVAASDPWRVLTSVATFSGLFLVTLAITYLVSVVSAVVGRRALALQVHAFGEIADEIVSKAWTGAGFSSAFIQQLCTLAKQLVTVAEQHLAYPVLHYFHSGQRQTSAPVAMAVLDDAMLLLGAAVVPPARPDHVVLDYVRDAIGRCLATIPVVSTPRGLSAPPPAPELDGLAEAGVPLVSRSEFANAVAAESQRRTALLRLVAHDGWPWR